MYIFLQFSLSNPLERKTYKPGYDDDDDDDDDVMMMMIDDDDDVIIISTLVSKNVFFRGSLQTQSIPALGYKVGFPRF